MKRWRRSVPRAIVPRPPENKTIGRVFGAFVTSDEDSGGGGGCASGLLAHIPLAGPTTNTNTNCRT